MYRISNTHCRPFTLSASSWFAVFGEMTYGSAELARSALGIDALIVFWARHGQMTRLAADKAGGERKSI